MNMLERTEQWTDAGVIKLHGPDAFEGMRRAGRLAAETLDFITPHVAPGISTGELDRLCHEFIVTREAVPAPLGYRGFPKSICTSVNHVVCHGIPGDKRLEDGDIINIDVTTIVDGWHGDTSRMFTVGERTPVKARKLIDVTYEAMMRGIEVVKPGATASRWCATSAAMGWGESSTTRRRSCISAGRAKARCCAKACSSPSSRW
jgi:methionyl aminopeptidase